MVDFRGIFPNSKILQFRNLRYEITYPIVDQLQRTNLGDDRSFKIAKKISLKKKKKNNISHSAYLIIFFVESHTCFQRLMRITFLPGC